MVNAKLHTVLSEKKMVEHAVPVMRRLLHAIGTLFQ
jgi:hypothetical protein